MPAAGRTWACEDSEVRQAGDVDAHALAGLPGAAPLNVTGAGVGAGGGLQSSSALQSIRWSRRARPDCALGPGRRWTAATDSVSAPRPSNDPTACSSGSRPAAAGSSSCSVFVVVVVFDAAIARSSSFFRREPSSDEVVLRHLRPEHRHELVLRARCELPDELLLSSGRRSRRRSRRLLFFRREPREGGQFVLRQPLAERADEVWAPSLRADLLEELILGQAEWIRPRSGLLQRMDQLVLGHVALALRCPPLVRAGSSSSFVRSSSPVRTRRAELVKGTVSPPWRRESPEVRRSDVSRSLSSRYVRFESRHVRAKTGKLVSVVNAFGELPGMAPRTSGRA